MAMAKQKHGVFMKKHATVEKWTVTELLFVYVFHQGKIKQLIKFQEVFS